MIFLYIFGGIMGFGILVMVLEWLLTGKGCLSKNG
jgi:hypothetical protein